MLKVFNMPFVLILSAFLFTNIAYAEQLSSQEITALFSGRTAECIKTKDNSTCDTFMSKQGDVKRHTHKDNKLRLGKWYADDNNQLCIQWQGKTKALCFTVNKNIDRTYNLDRKGKTKSTITGLSAGDTTGR